MSEHIDDDTLEKYLLSMLNPTETEQVETHLLQCEECRVRTAALQDYIETMKKALGTTDAPAKQKLNRN
jgi:anti-sigma factor RsiW